MLIRIFYVRMDSEVLYCPTPPYKAIFSVYISFFSKDSNHCHCHLPFPIASGNHKQKKKNPMTHALFVIRYTSPSVPVVF